MTGLGWPDARHEPSAQGLGWPTAHLCGAGLDELGGFSGDSARGACVQEKGQGPILVTGGGGNGLEVGTESGTRPGGEGAVESASGLQAGVSSARVRAGGLGAGGSEQESMDARVSGFPECAAGENPAGRATGADTHARWQWDPTVVRRIGGEDRTRTRAYLGAAPAVLPGGLVASGVMSWRAPAVRSYAEGGEEGDPCGSGVGTAILDSRETGAGSEVPALSVSGGPQIDKAGTDSATMPQRRVSDPTKIESRTGDGDVSGDQEGNASPDERDAVGEVEVVGDPADGEVTGGPGEEDQPSQVVHRGEVRPEEGPPDSGSDAGDSQTGGCPGIDGEGAPDGQPGRREGGADAENPEANERTGDTSTSGPDRSGAIDQWSSPGEGGVLGGWVNADSSQADGRGASTGSGGSEGTGGEDLVAETVRRGTAGDPDSAGGARPWCGQRVWCGGERCGGERCANGRPGFHGSPAGYWSFGWFGRLVGQGGDTWAAGLPVDGRHGGVGDWFGR